MGILCRAWIKMNACVPFSMLVNKTTNGRAFFLLFRLYYHPLVSILTCVSSFGNTRLYYVHWVDLNRRMDSWEPESNLKEAPADGKKNKRGKLTRGVEKN